ncbi:MAG: AAA family ATPase [Bacilli bacterium]|nr:AAA family ATPase [Bacilli bacterium]
MSVIKNNIMCIFGVKGGIGKSTLTLNLAGVCSNLKKKVLIVDMDLYGGSIALSLNKEVHKTIYNFVDDYINNRYKDLNDYITTYNDYIDFIACPKDPRKANKINSEYIEILLDKAKFNYDLVLIDTTHILDEINLNLLDKSHKVLFVLSNDSYDIKNMRSLISIFKDLEIEKYKVVLNNSLRPNREYFNLYDIKNVIKTNIDYELSSKFYIKDIDKYVMDANIITLDNKYINTEYYKVLEGIVDYAIGEDYE